MVFWVLRLYDIRQFPNFPKNSETPESGSAQSTRLQAHCPASSLLCAVCLRENSGAVMQFHDSGRSRQRPPNLRSRRLRESLRFRPRPNRKVAGAGRDEECICAANWNGAASTNAACSLISTVLQGALCALKPSEKANRRMRRTPWRVKECWCEPHRLYERFLRRRAAINSIKPAATSAPPVLMAAGAGAVCCRDHFSLAGLHRAMRLSSLAVAH
jgi:hypothetical protein